jgi:hypothetical protein
LCSHIINDTQCSSEEVTFEGGCTWIYEKNDLLLSNGNCVNTSTTEYSCENLNRTDQCDDGANIESLKGKCKTYKNEDGSKDICKVRCEKLGKDECNNREDDCFWLEGNSTTEEGTYQIPAKCVDKVYVYIHIHISISIYLYIYIYLIIISNFYISFSSFFLSFFFLFFFFFFFFFFVFIFLY